MTAVEFYDRTPIENVISSLTTVPNKIIFIGDGKAMKKFEHVYKIFLESREANISTIHDYLKYIGVKYVSIKGLLRTLDQKHLIYSFKDEGQNI